MYKCGWNGCEKAYGTLNHLNAHVTMQSHGSKRTPEGTCPTLLRLGCILVRVTRFPRVFLFFILFFILLVFYHGTNFDGGTREYG